MKTLIEINNELQEFDAMLDHFDGDLENPDVITKLEEIENQILDDLENKADNYAAFIKTLMYRAKARKEEADRIKKLAHTDENNAKSLAERLKFVLMNNDIKKLDTARFKLSVGKAGGKAPLIIADDFNDKSYVVEEVVEKIDKEKIREELESGKKIEGCKFGERKFLLRIK